MAVMNKNLAELITTFLNFRNNEYWGDHILTMSIKDTGDCSIWLFTLEMSKDDAYPTKLFADWAKEMGREGYLDVKKDHIEFSFIVPEDEINASE